MWITVTYSTFCILYLPDLSLTGQSYCTLLFHMPSLSLPYTQDRSEEACVAPRGAAMLTLCLVLCILRDQALFEQRLATQSNPDLFIPRSSYSRTTKHTSFSSLLAAMFVQYVTSHIHSFWVQGCCVYTVEERLKKKAFNYCGIVWDMTTVFCKQAFFSCVYRDWLKEMNRWMDREGGCNIDHVLWAQPVWLVRWRRGAATCVFVPRSSIKTLMSKVTINLSIKKQNKQKAENDSSP